MKNWNYFELIAHYYSNYFNAIEQKRSIDTAIGSTFENFYFQPTEQNIIANLISTILNLKLQISLLQNVSLSSVNLYKTYISQINDDLLKLELETSEIEHLKESITEINLKLKTIEII